MVCRPPARGVVADVATLRDFLFQIGMFYIVAKQFLLHDAEIVIVALNIGEPLGAARVVSSLDVQHSAVQVELIVAARTRLQAFLAV